MWIITATVQGTNNIRHLLALVGAHHILHVSRVRVKLSFRPLFMRPWCLVYELLPLPLNKAVHRYNTRNEIANSCASNR
jgi:hypothetical protein